MKLRIHLSRALHGALCGRTVPLAADLGRGWISTCLHPGSEKKGVLRGAEWVTSFGCDVRMLRPALLRGCA